MSKNSSLKRPVLLEWLLFGAQALLSLLLIAFVIYSAVLIYGKESSGSTGIEEAVITIVYALLFVLAIIATVPTLVSTVLSLVFSVGLTRKYKSGNPEKGFVLKAIVKTVCLIIIGLFFGYLSVELVISSPFIGIISSAVTISVIVLFCLTIVGCIKRRALKRKEEPAEAVE